MTEIQTKKCKRCDKNLEATRSNFYYQKGPRDGLSSTCIPCTLIKAKEYRNRPGQKEIQARQNKKYKQRQPKKGRKPPRDLTGRIFGTLTVQRRAEHRKKKESPRWVCVCSCGETTIKWASSLLDGKSTRCAACGIAAKRKPRIKIIEKDGIEYKKCTKCLKVLLLTDFECRDDPRTLTGKRPIAECKTCRSMRSRRDLLKKKYGISLEDFDMMLEKQDFSCALCKTKKPKGHSNQWHVDHCHTTGRIRGLLCSQCNTVLGQYELMKKLDPEKYLTGDEYGLPLSVGKWSASVSCVQ